MNNLNTKTIIQIVVIVVAFGGSGFVVYNGMFKKSSNPAVTPVAIENAVMEQKVLPYGESMDFNAVLNKQNLKYGTITYPKLNPGQEVGIPEDGLIRITEKETK